MKLKGITKAEMHVEKIVLGLFALFFLFVLLMQAGLIGGSRSVKVGSRELPMDKAMEAVAESARQREAAIKSESVAEGIPSSLPSPLEKFREARDATSSASALASLAPLGPAGLAGSAESSSGSSAPVIALGDKPFINVEPPAPTKPLVALYEGTIDPFEVKKHEGLAALVPAAQPFDIRTVSLQTSFDAEKLRALMAAAPSDGSAQALPRTLWESRVEIVDVQWIREERGADGSWGTSTIIPPLPGRASLRDIISKTDFQPGDFRTLLEREAVARADVRRPAFYDTISGSQWVWPSMAATRSAQDVREKADAKVRQIRGLREEIKRLEDVVNKSGRDGRRPGGRPGERTSPPPGGRQPPPGGGGGDGGAGGGGGGAGGGSDGPGGENDNSTAQIPSQPDDDFVWPKIDPTWLAQGIGGGGGGGGDAGDNEGDQDADKRRQEAERRQIEAARKQLETKKAELQKLTSELLELGFDETGKQIESASAFTELLNSIASGESTSITLWGHDATARPGASYRYKALVHLTNPFFGRADNIPVGREDLIKAPTLVSAESEWSDSVELAPSVMYFITSASPAGGALGTSAKAGAEVFEFYYGYWRKADVALSPGDAISSEIYLPELNTFELPADTVAAPSGPGATKPETKSLPVERRREVDAGAFFIDTAPLPADAQKIAAIVRDAESGLKTLVPELRSAIYRHIADSAATGKTAVVRNPGTTPAQAAPANPTGAPDSPNTPNTPNNPNAPGGNQPFTAPRGRPR